MLINQKWFKSAVAAMALSSGVSAHATENDESFQLSQMRALSQMSSPEQAAPTKPEGSDLLAETDLKNLAKQDNLSDIKNIKPEFKPTLSDLKPKL